MTWLNSHIIFKAVKLVTRVVQVWDFPLMTVPAEMVKKQSIAKLMERKKKAFQRYRRGVQRRGNAAYGLNM